MRILYLSCHSILEYDEVSLFRRLGHYVFSPGAYVEPRNPGDASLRPALDIDYEPEDIEAWHKFQVPGEDGKDRLTKEFVDRFDVVIVMHLPRWIINNWDAIKHKPVVWRTIGQSVEARERELAKYRAEGLKIVRYSPMELNIPGQIGADAIIRFYKRAGEFLGWNGAEESVITFQQDFPNRKQACNFEIWDKVTSRFDRKLFGPHNEGIAGWEGKLPYNELKAAMRDHRCYFYVGTHPASYTLNFMEAWMTGIPIVAIGAKWGNDLRSFPGHDLYEIPHLIENGVTGFISDNEEDLVGYTRELLRDEVLAQQISVKARERAVEVFGEHVISPQWQRFLNSL